MSNVGGHVYAWLRDGASRDANVDGSVTPVEFVYENNEFKTVELERMLVYVEDNGTFDSDKYGNGLVLTTGVGVAIKTAADVIRLDLLDGEPIKTIGEWAAMCYDVDHQDYGVGNEYAAVRWTFARAGKPLRIRRGERLVVTINDDLSTLVAHWFQVQGHYTS
jgi:hypothetical protein